MQRTAPTQGRASPARLLVALPVSVLLPPAAVYLSNPSRLHLLISTALFLLGWAVFFLLFAGIGLILIGCSMVYALAVSVIALAARFLSSH